MRRSFVLFGLFFLLAGTLGAQETAAAGHFHRIVSVTLMGDEFLALVAEPDQMAAYSRFADDSVLSNVGVQASRVAGRTWLNLESLLKFKPDLVVAADWSDGSLLSFLKEKGVAVYVIKTPRTWGEVLQQVSALAVYLGREKTGTELLDRLSNRERALASLVSSLPRKKSLLEYSAFGTSMGRGTLWTDVCRLAGVTNLADRLQADTYGYAPLSKEILVRLDPDILVLPDDLSLKLYNRTTFVADLKADPLFRSLRAVKSGSLVFIGESLRTTASPFALDAAEKLFHAAYPNLR